MPTNENTLYVIFEYNPVIFKSEKYNLPFTITGTVYTDDTKETTVNGATVSLINSTTTDSYISGVTDSNGEFTLTYTPGNSFTSLFYCRISIIKNTDTFIESLSVPIIINHIDNIMYNSVQLVNIMDSKGVSAYINDGLYKLIQKVNEIEGSVGGVVIDTAVTCAPNSSIIYLGNTLTLTGILSCAYDDISTADDDMIGFLQHSTVKIYNGDIYLGSCQTNNTGEYTFQYTPAATGSLTLKAVYESDIYNDSQSSTVTVNVRELIIDDIELESDKEILSYVNGDEAILTAQLMYQGSPATTSDVTVDFEIYKDSTLVKTLSGDTDATGVATVSYISKGTGDISIRAVVGSIISSEISVEDCIKTFMNTYTSSTTFDYDLPTTFKIEYELLLFENNNKNSCYMCIGETSSKALFIGKVITKDTNYKVYVRNNGDIIHTGSVITLSNDWQTAEITYDGSELLFNNDISVTNFNGISLTKLVNVSLFKEYTTSGQIRNIKIKQL